MLKPDTSSEQKLLLYLSRPGETPTASGEIQKLLHSYVNWDLLIRLAEIHGTAPVVYSRVKSVKGAPSGALDRLRRAYVAVAHKNMKIFNAYSQISGAFKGAGIEVIALKGVHLAADVYSSVALRPMQDMDLLVKKTDIPEARRIMGKLNFVQPYTKITEAPRIFDHHLPPYFSNDGTFLVEIHYGIFMGNLVSASELKHIWGRAVTVSFNETNLRVLSPEDLLLHLAFHLTYHHNFSFGLRGLLDIARAMERYKETLDWDKIVTSARMLDISLSLFASFKKIDTFFSISPPPEIFLKMKEGCSRHQLSRIQGENEGLSFLLSPGSLKSNPFTRLFWVRSWVRKIKLLLLILFPYPSVVSLQFGTKSTSIRTILFYFYRPIQLLKTYFFLKH